MNASSVCRELALRVGFATLATVSRDPPGYPFATLVAIAVDARGRPLLLLSRLAEHTKNLDADRRASILITEPGLKENPLAAGRMTLVGTCCLVTESDGARATFLGVHPEATEYAGLPDFAMWRLEVGGVRWIGGFGRMEWVSGADYTGEPATHGYH